MRKILIGSLIFFSLIYIFLGFQKHQHFQTFAWDSSVFIQELYLVSNFQPPYSSMLHSNGLGDHFQITFLVIGGLLYKIWGNDLTLFIFQGFFGVFSALPLFLITRHLLSQTKLKTQAIFWLSLLLSWSYLLSVSFQSMMVDEFHNEPIAAFFFLLMLFFMVIHKKRWFWISFLLVLLTKEIYGLLALPLAIYFYLTQKNLKQSLLISFTGLTFFYLSVFHIMPGLSGSKEYLHFAPGNHPSDILAKIVKQPLFLLISFFDNSEKIKTIFSGLLAFSFLPLLAPETWILPLFSLAIRFYDGTTPRLYEFNNHYSAPFIPLTAFSAAFGLVKIVNFLTNQKKFSIKKTSWILSMVLITFTLSQNIIYHGPINSLLKKDFYQTSGWQSDAQQLLQQVPKNVTIASQNSLLPHLSARSNFYLLPETKDAQFIAVDLSDGPNKFSPITQTQMKELINELVESKKYQIIWQKNQALLLKKSI